MAVLLGGTLQGATFCSRENVFDLSIAQIISTRLVARNSVANNLVIAEE